MFSDATLSVFCCKLHGCALWHSCGDCGCRYLLWLYPVKISKHLVNLSSSGYTQFLLKWMRWLAAGRFVHDRLQLAAWDMPYTFSCYALNMFGINGFVQLLGPKSFILQSSHHNLFGFCIQSYLQPNKFNFSGEELMFLRAACVECEPIGLGSCATVVRVRAFLKAACCYNSWPATTTTSSLAKTWSLCRSNHSCVPLI